MSQLNNIGGTGSRVAEDLRQIKLDRKQLERRDKEIRFKCDHKDNHGRAALQQSQEDGLLVCRICGTRINAKVQNKVEVDRKLQEVINIVECIKLAAGPEVVPALARVEEGVDSLLDLYEKAILKGGQKNKNNNQNNNQQKRANYKASKL